MTNTTVIQGVLHALRSPKQDAGTILRILGPGLIGVVAEEPERGGAETQKTGYVSHLYLQIHQLPVTLFDVKPESFQLDSTCIDKSPLLRGGYPLSIFNQSCKGQPYPRSSAPRSRSPQYAGELSAQRRRVHGKACGRSAQRLAVWMVTALDV